MGKQNLSLVKRDKNDIPRMGLTKWQRRFIEALRDLPHVALAAKMAGVHRATCYTHRKENAEFRDAWDDALGASIDALESQAFKLAMAGDSTLVTFLLRAHKPEYYNPAQKHEVGLLGGIVFLPEKTEAVVSERVVWRPNVGPQTEFLASPAREVFYAGSVGQR